MTDAPIVVVGAGVAGLRYVEALRRLGAEDHVVWIGAEEHLPYNRPPLSKAVLSGPPDAEIPLLRPADAYAELDVKPLLGVRVVAADEHRRTLTLSDGSSVDWRHLVVATGLAPRRLPQFEGVPRSHVLRTWSDARSLRADLQPGDHVTVIGGGVLGCESAATLRGLGHQVALIEAAPHPMSRVVGADLGAAIARLLADHGVSGHYGAPLSQVDPSGARTRITLADGRAFETDVILLATGASPQLDWLAGTSVRIDDGVVVDEFGRSSVEHIWAIGDVARRPHPSGTGSVRLEFWTNAADTAAQVAGNTIAATTGAMLQELSAAPYFWSDQFTLKLQAVGLPAPDDAVELVDGQIGCDRFLAITHQDGAATGLLAANMPGQIIRSRAPFRYGMPVSDLLALQPWAPRKRP